MSDGVNPAVPAPLAERFLESVAACLNKDALLALANLRLDKSASDRLELLAEKANEGQLTPGERQEYRAYIESADLVTMLQLRARERIGTAQAL